MTQRETLLRLVDLAETIHQREDAISAALETTDISLVGDDLYDLICDYAGISPDSDAAMEVIYSDQTSDEKVDQLLGMAA